MKPKAIITDLDGTLALLNGRDPYKHQHMADQDVLNVQLANVIELYVKSGFKLIVVTGRWEEHQALTIKWLEKHGFKPDELFMRPMANYDTGTRLKEWYLENIILQRYNPYLAFEDLSAIAKMYRSHEIQCWQVNNDPWYKEEV